MPGLPTPPTPPLRLYPPTTLPPPLQPSLTVIYPLTSVDWAWISEGMAEMAIEGEGVREGWKGGGDEGLYKEEAALDGNWLRLAP